MGPLEKPWEIPDILIRGHPGWNVVKRLKWKDFDSSEKY
jgi:hypothetical protein